MTVKTIEVTHPGTHYPTDAEILSVLRDALKEDGLKLAGDASFVVVENTSGGPSKVRATFETEPTAAAAKAAEPKGDGKK